MKRNLLWNRVIRKTRTHSSAGFWCEKPAGGPQLVFPNFRPRFPTGISDLIEYSLTQRIPLSRRLFWVRASATRGHARSLKSVGFGKVVRACSHLIYLVSVPASRRGKARWRATPLGGLALSYLWHKKGSECGRAGRAGGLASCLVSSWASPPRGETQALDSTRATRLYPLYHQFEECDRQIVLMAPALCFLLGGGGEGE